MKKIISLVAVCLLMLGLGVGGASAARLITGTDIKDGTVTTKDLSAATIKTLTANATGKPGQNGTDGVNGATGEQGPKGEKGDTGAQGPKGDKGEQGDPASDVLGAGSRVLAGTVVIANIGGSFNARSTSVGEFTLPAGTYLLTVNGFFDRIDNGVGSSPQMQVAVRYQGEDYGTILTGNFPATGDREINGSAVKVVVSNGTTPITVRAFGYNNDGSSAGSGNYTASIDIAAVRLG